MVDSFAPEILALAAAVGALAGLVRGITGFGGAMVMTPPLALMLGPLLAVPAVLLLEAFVAGPMLIETRRTVHWAVIGPIMVACCVAVPLGSYILVKADPQLLRRVIAAIVIVFSTLLLRGWRYHGAQRLSTSVGLGTLSGVMVGATSIGGPPIILYLLAGPDRIQTTRANLTFYVAVSSAASLAMLWIAGAFDPRAAWMGAALAPLYYGGMVAGFRLFARFDEARFRQLALVLMMAVSAGVLLA